MRTLEQLTPEAYGTLVAGLSQPQHTALLGAVGGMLSCREGTLGALRRKGLVGATPQTMQSLTVLGRRLRAGLLAPPGTFGSAVVQALLDGGLPWGELATGAPLGPTVHVETYGEAKSAWVALRTPSGVPVAEGLEEAERLLRQAGFGVARTEGRAPRLLVSGREA